jgi:peptide/nickel transport system substrate-binding protein
MKRTAFRFFAILSLMLTLGTALRASTRPRYGDSVRAEVRAAVPEYEGAPELLTGTVFETLVNIDDAGRAVPGLATSWLTPNGGYRWEFTLRNGIQLHDGSALTPLIAAKSLAQATIPGCKLLVAPSAVVVDCDTAQPALPGLLSQPRYSVATSGSNGQAVGTGLFAINKRDGGNFSLRANDEYWNGRSYLDSLEITTSRTSRDQITDYALDRADVIEVSVDDLRRMQADRARLDISRPSETVLLLINSSKPELRDPRLRQSISLAIDRASLQSVIFQRQGEIAGGLLPNWLTGYSFLFATVQDLNRAKQLRTAVGQVQTLTIAYDPVDPTDRLIAERVALNVRDIGVTMTPVAGNSGDIRIRRVTVDTVDPAVSLANLVERLGMTVPPASLTMEALYQRERAAVQIYTAIPLVHLPRIAAVKARVHNWSSGPTGRWQLENLWVTPRSAMRPDESRP